MSVWCVGGTALAAGRGAPLQTERRSRTFSWRCRGSRLECRCRTPEVDLVSEGSAKKEKARDTRLRLALRQSSAVHKRPRRTPVRLPLPGDV